MRTPVGVPRLIRSGLGEDPAPDQRGATPPGLAPRALPECLQVKRQVGCKLVHAGGKNAGVYYLAVSSQSSVQQSGWMDGWVDVGEWVEGGLWHGF